MTKIGALRNVGQVFDQDCNVFRQDPSHPQLFPPSLPTPFGSYSLGYCPRRAIYPDLSCSAWFVAYVVAANGAKFTRCPTAISMGSPSLLFPALQSRSHNGDSN